jgi:hypothetical protein
MDIQSIAQRARLPVRKVRYVIDQRLLPGLRARLQTALPGQPRSYTDMEGFFIACAAVLLDGGVQRRTISEIMARLADMPWPLPGTPDASPTSKHRIVGRPQTVLTMMYRASKAASEVLIGDGMHLRLRLHGTDTGWLESRTLVRLEKDYRPTVVIQLDLGVLRTAFGRPDEI